MKHNVLLVLFFLALNVNVSAICSVTISGKTIVCAGDSTTLTAVPAGGLAPFTYLWSNNDTTQSITVTAGTYSVSIVDSAGCSATSSTVTITVNPLPTVVVTPLSTPQICVGGCATLTASGALNYSWSPDTGLSSTTGAIVTACPPSFVTYTVTGTDSNGCSNSASKKVIVKLAPQFTFCSLPPLCKGNCDSIFPICYYNSPSILYTWNPPLVNGKACPLVTTTYTIIGNLVNCKDTTTLTITVDSLPKLCLASHIDSLCIGNSILMCDTCPDSTYHYLWTPGNTTSCINVTPNGTTTFTLTVTDGLGCSTKDSIIVIVFQNPCPLGIGESTAKTTATIYPNPFRNSFTLWIPTEVILENPVFTIYNMLGEELKEIIINKEETIISNQNLIRDIYYYNLVSKRRLINGGKLIVQ